MADATTPATPAERMLAAVLARMRTDTQYLIDLKYVSAGTTQITLSTQSLNALIESMRKSLDDLLAISPQLVQAQIYDQMRANSAAADQAIRDQQAVAAAQMATAQAAGPFGQIGGTPA